jgi:hypothetical protein
MNGATSANAGERSWPRIIHSMNRTKLSGVVVESNRTFRTLARAMTFSWGLGDSEATTHTNELNARIPQPPGAL